MSVFAISDLHLSLGANKSMDVFDGWENYIEKLKCNWCNKVSENDTVVIAGDISWGSDFDECVKDFEFIEKLPGKKIFIKGNHDYWWTTISKLNKFLEKNSFKTISFLFNCAYAVEKFSICGTRGWILDPKESEDKKVLAREIARLKASLDYITRKDLEPIVFFHYPPIYKFEKSEEFINILIERNVKKCYYGHIHGSGMTKKVVEGNYRGVDFKLISCDYLNFCPLEVV